MVIRMSYKSNTDIIQLLTSYRMRINQIALLRYELKHLSTVSPDETRKSILQKSETGSKIEG